MPASRARPGLILLGSLTFSLLLASTGCMYGAGASGHSSHVGPLDNFHVIEPQQAYRSAQLNANALRSVICAYGIRTVVNMRGPAPGARWYDEEVATTGELGINHVDIAWKPEQLPLKAELLKLYDTFRTAPCPILIHCKAGADRTGAAAAIWRMEIHGDTRERALRELSLAYGHLGRLRHMDEVARMFQNDRDWIVRCYPGSGGIPRSQLMTSSVLNSAQAGQTP